MTTATTPDVEAAKGLERMNERLGVLNVKAQNDNHAPVWASSGQGASCGPNVEDRFDFSLMPYDERAYGDGAA